MNKLLVAAAVCAIAAAAPARAADLPAYEAAPLVEVPGFSWTGAYLGVQAGYAWGRSDVAGADFDPDGFLVGGYAGYNVQLDGSPLVLGVETDFNYSDSSRKRSAGGLSVRNDGEWAGATRARIGYAFDRFMVYGAAGVAYADREIRVSDGFNSARSSKTAIGYTVGGGVEAAVTENVLVRGEYRYTDYGSDGFGFGGGLGSVRSDLDEHRVMGGVAYKFGW